MILPRVILAFSLCLLADLIILPALFGFYFGFLSIALIVCIILIMGPSYETLFYSFGLSLIYEIFVGYPIGTMILPFLLVIAMLFIMSRFISLDIFRKRPEISHRFIVPAIGTVLFFIILTLVELGFVFMRRDGVINFGIQNYFNFKSIIYVYCIVFIGYLSMLKLMNYGIQKRL